MTEPKIYSFDSSLLPDANPKDGFCVDLVRVGDYASLKAERDALERQLSMSEAKCKGYFSDAAAALVKCDVLAVENAALKDGFEWLYAIVSSDEVSIPDEKYSAVTNAAAVLSETPATDAALAAIREQACKALIDAFVRQVDAAGLDDSDSVTIFECRDTMKYAAEQAINPREAK
ncbi:hypothetical protein ACTVPS_01720 [Serratia marcescens]|uniref:hypothetical protein n=1 Tax=Serratia marcescens TaxID=615 RepID=UPI003FA789CB